MKSTREYSSDIPARMYTFFRDYSDGGAPSLVKFAMRIGVTLAELEGWRREDEFDRALRECLEIRKDHLIHAALQKRYDSSMTKFLLTTEFGMEKDECERELEVTLEVIGE